MSLAKMLTKMAVGFAVAKGMQKVSEAGGIGKVMEGLSQAGGSGGGGLGDLMGSLGGGSGGGAGGGGGLGDIMGNLAGGAGGGAGGGGLGGLLGGLAGGAGGGAAGGAGGIGDLLGGLMGGGGGAGAASVGGLGGLLGGLAAARGGSGGGLEALLNQEQPADEPDEEDTAGLMIRAMVMAARSDGEIDADEQEQLMSTLGSDAGEAEMAFVRTALQAPVDPAAIAADTPKGLETQVYSMSVMAITPDNAKEANYLHGLAGALGIQPATVNEIHDNFGVPHLYS